MTESSVEPPSIFSAPSYKCNEAFLIANNTETIKLLESSDALRRTPAGWDISRRLMLNNNVGGYVNDLIRRISHLVESPSELDTLRSYLIYVLSTYQRYDRPNDYLQNQYHKVLRYRTTGQSSHLTKAMESSFLLFVLGPFTEQDNPSYYIDPDHLDYNIQVREFGIYIHEFYGKHKSLHESISDRNVFITEHFCKLGTELRKVIWQSQSK